jgi:ATP-binding cassette subfamily B protein
MGSLAGTTTVRPREADVRVRSVVPGRQRWDVPSVLGRPRTAEVLEGALSGAPGVKSARANPVTGGVLILHDTSLDTAGIARLLQRAVTALAEKAGSRKRTPHQRTGQTPPTRTGRATAAAAIPLAFTGRVRRSLESPERPSSVRDSPAALLDIVGPHKPRLYLATMSSVACQVAEMALGLFLGWTGLVLIKGECAPLLRLGLTGASGQLWFLTGAVAVASAAVAGLSYTSNVAWRRLGQDVQHDWRNETYAHVQKLHLGDLEGERTTRVAGVLTEDVAQLGNFFATTANDVVQLATSFLVLVPAFLLLAPGIAWIAFLPMPIVAWLSFRHHDRVATDYAASSEHRAHLHSRLLNNLEATATVKSFCTEDYEAEQIEQLGDTCRESHDRTDRSTVRHSETVRACTTAAMAGTLLVGGMSVLDGKLDFEVFSPLIGLPQTVLLRVTRLGGIVDQYQRTVTAFHRVQRLRSLPVEPVGSDRPLDGQPVEGAITLDRVTFAYPGRPPVLENLCLRIAPGQVTGIVGATGAGKTTIAKLLMRFQDPDSGRVLLDGRDVRELSRRDLRHAVGFVAQDPFLFDGTIADNIRYGSFEAGHDHVVRAARMAEAHGFIEAMPASYDTLIGERGAALSGGQRQRIALARAILKDSPMVVLDEATSAVDNETEAAIQRTLRGFAADRTLVIIAHRLSTIRNADRIYVMDHGGVVAEAGTHTDLLAREGLYASLWRLQAGEKVA